MQIATQRLVLRRPRQDDLGPMFVRAIGFVGAGRISRFRGQGLVIEASRAFIDHAFRNTFLLGEEWCDSIYLAIRR